MDYIIIGLLAVQVLSIVASWVYLYCKIYSVASVYIAVSAIAMFAILFRDSHF